MKLIFALSSLVLLFGCQPAENNKGSTTTIGTAPNLTTTTPQQTTNTPTTSSTPTTTTTQTPVVVDIAERADVRAGISSWRKNSNSTVTITYDSYVLPKGNVVGVNSVTINNIVCTFSITDLSTSAVLDSSSPIHILSSGNVTQFYDGETFYYGGYLVNGSKADVPYLTWRGGGKILTHVWFDVTFYNISDITGYGNRVNCTFDEVK